MSTIAEQIRAAHHPGREGCTCGLKPSWGWTRHIAEVTERAVRDRIAADIEAFRRESLRGYEPAPCEDADEGYCHYDARSASLADAARIAGGDSR